MSLQWVNLNISHENLSNLIELIVGISHNSIFFCRMAMKEWFRQMQPVQLCLMFWLTLAFFIVQMIMSHTTHSLTLLIDAYYVLCSLIALAGRIFTIKVRICAIVHKKTIRELCRIDKILNAASLYLKH